MRLSGFGAFEFGSLGGDLDVGVLDQRSEVINGLLSLAAQSLSVPGQRVFDVGEEVLSLGGLSEDGNWFIRVASSDLDEGFNDLLNIVAIDDDSVPAERLESLVVNFDVVLIV